MFASHELAVNFEITFVQFSSGVHEASLNTDCEQIEVVEPHILYVCVFQD